jgi:CheY-like chemotaxis protein
MMDEPMPERTFIVLIVDDDHDWVTVLTRNLPSGCQSIAVGSYQDAVTALSNASFDLVIVDLNLADENVEEQFAGMELLARIRERGSARHIITRVAVISAYATVEQLREMFKSHGVDYFFPKQSFSPSDYRRIVNQVLRQSTHGPSSRIVGAADSKEGS